MKKRKVKYTDEPIGEIKIVGDFLPKPKDLVLKEDFIIRIYSLSKWFIISNVI